MLRALPWMIGFAVAATGAAAELTDAEAETIRCAATGVVLSAALSSFVEAGADLSEEYLNIVDRAALDLLLDAEPLFGDVEGANAEMSRSIDEMVTIQDTALRDGEIAQWMQQTTDVVRVCHMASPRFGRVEQ